MKRVFLVILLTIQLFSCEDVIDVDVPLEAPRLNIDALIRVQNSINPTTIEVKAMLTSSFFDVPEPASLNEITITNLSIPDNGSLNTIFLTEVENERGLYTNTVDNDFLTEGSLELRINYNGNIFTAITAYVPTVPFEKIEQGSETLFNGEETEVIVSYQDDPLREDYYLFDFDFDEFLVSEDEFYQGQLFEFSYFYDDEINTGQEVEISIMGVNREFFNYMNQLIVQAGGDQGPFQTPAATVKGNIINTSERNNFALGYFAVVQEFKENITLE